MAQMQALLKIKADVEGEGKINALGRAIGGLSGTAGKVSGGLKGLAGAAGGLSGALGSLVPLATGAGLAAMAKGAIDAADNMNDLSQKTGVSVESLSKFQQAANASGTSIEGVGAAMIKLNKNLGAGVSDDYAKTIEKSMDDAVSAVKRGEKQQTTAVELAADQRLKALNQESDERLKEINKRYRNEQKIVDDQFDDREQMANEADETRQRSEERALERQFDIRKKAIQDDKSLSDDRRNSLLESLRIEEEDVVNRLDSGYEKQRKARSRQFRDAKQQQDDALDERKETEIKKNTSRLEAEKTITKDYALQQVALIKETTEKQIDSFNELSKGPEGAAAALKFLGISAKDASGKLKSTDTIMLEVANKFKAMPDGANKTALAMQLFGKAGADMIPMLNGGRKSIEDLAATMTGPFAKGADGLNDKLAELEGKLLILGVGIGTALMPLLNGVANAVLAAANAFAAMPGPLQAIVGGAVALAAAFVLLAPAISAIISIAGVLSGLQIGATIAGWAAVAGPAIIAIQTAFAGFMAFLTGTLLPGLIAFFSGPVGWTVLAVAAVVAMVVLFREPIMQFFAWLGQTISTAFSGLMALLQPIFVQPFIDLWNNVLRGPVTAMFSWIGGYIKASMQTAYALMYQVFIQPWINVWNTLKGPVTTFFNWVGGVVKAGMHTALKLAYAVFVKPWVDLWSNALRKPVTAGIKWIQDTWKGISKFFTDNVTTPISKAWTTMTEFLPKAMNTIGDKVKSIFTGVVNTIKSALRSVLQFIANAINSVGAEVNRLIGAFNALPGPNIPFVPVLSVPQFAKGGVVTGPTLAMVGEGGEPEYIIPQSKMAAASTNYLNGARGGAVIPAFAKGGYVGGGSTGSIAATSSGSTNNTQISVTTGPVMQMDGEQYITMADLERAMRMTADGVYASLRTPAGRYAVGTR